MSFVLLLLLPCHLLWSACPVTMFINCIAKFAPQYEQPLYWPQTWSQLHLCRFDRLDRSKLANFRTPVFECELTRILVAWVNFNLWQICPTPAFFLVIELLFGFLCLASEGSASCFGVPEEGHCEN